MNAKVTSECGKRKCIAIRVGFSNFGLRLRAPCLLTGTDVVGDGYADWNEFRDLVYVLLIRAN